ncbi:MAG: hypothetical protein WKF57_06660 [Nakamurella sp.]
MAKTTSPSDPSLSATELAKMVMRFREAQPLTDAYEAKHSSGRVRTVWYRSQREHLHGFWGEYDSPGAYGRSKPGQGAKFAYNHLRCVPGLMWLAEAVGVDKHLIVEGIEAVEAAGSNLSSQCAAFRRQVPWALIEERLGVSKKESLGWLSALRRR